MISQPIDDLLQTEEGISAAEAAISDFADLLVDEPEAEPLRLNLDPKPPERDEREFISSLVATMTAQKATLQTQAKDLFEGEAEVPTLSSLNFNIGKKTSGKKTRESLSVLRALKGKQ
eukprot:TRINITY_DN1085_c0_g1_i1.p1 TRINITY_DN1085_c0_g1~~TRINITY_DN1085_c0_g1_i1.p1  ORF type:complete len:118 (-),score=25.42 TRINITY_DN1085_c0_g1_i1:13-366(-)